MKEYFFKTIFILLGLFSVACTKDPSQKGIEVFPDMVHSVAFEAYGHQMQEAPKGSISLKYKPFHFGETPAEAERAGKELINPIEKNAASVARGKVLYTNTCQVCHGDTGKGDGPLIPKFPNPPSFTSQSIKKYADGRIYHVIVKGFGMMPGHAAQLNDDDRWNVVNYIRELQK